MSGAIASIAFVLAGTFAAVGATPPPPPQIGPEESAPTLRDDYVPPFASDPLALSDALQAAVKNNPDLAVAEVDVEISEARVLSALGAYDVTLTAKLDTGISENPQRGSQLAISLGQRRVGGGIGVERELETGGSVAVSFDSFRVRSDQPRSIVDPTAGTTTLTSYSVVPTLRVRHALLKGAGLKVNRAPIRKARVAKSAAEARRFITAQNLAHDLIVAYWDLLYAHRDLANKRNSVAQVQRQREITDSLVKAGRRSELDAKVVAQGQAAREAEAVAAEQRLLQASVKLRNLMGDDISTLDDLGVLPTTDPLVETRAVVVKDEVARAMKSNPEVRVAELDVASGRIDERVAKNGKLPQVDVDVGFTPQGRSVDTLADPMTGRPGTDASWGGAFGNMFNSDVSGEGLLADWTLTGTVSMAWDVQNRTAKGVAQEAALAVERGELVLEGVRRTLAARVVEASSGLRTASKMIEFAELSLELARENLAAEQSKYSAGRATNYDVLLRLDEVDDAAAEALAARVDYLKALADLQLLNGELLPAYGLLQ